MAPSRVARAAMLASTVLLASCIWVVGTAPRAEPLMEPVAVTSPVKAHLVDGSVVVFPSGVVYRQDSLMGQGSQYDLALRQTAARRSIPLDSILGVEAIQGGVSVLGTVALSALATGAVTIGWAGLMVATSGVALGW
jgi:hypothetical protein